MHYIALRHRDIEGITTSPAPLSLAADYSPHRSLVIDLGKLARAATRAASLR